MKPDVDKLRKTILQLAFEGKLVPQYKSDTPSKELLDSINVTRKARGKVNKGSENTQAVKNAPYEIPESWTWVYLGDYAEIIGGGTPSTSEDNNFTEDGIPWLTPADLGKWNEVLISKGKRDITEKGLSTSSARLLPKGSVLFTSRAPIGNVAIAANEITTNQGFKSLVPYEMKSNKYLYYYLKHSAKRINDSAPGTTFKEVSGSRLSTEMLPVPPLEEQKRIVEKIETLMALCDELDEKSDNFLEALTKLRQTILQLAVEGKLVIQDASDSPAEQFIESIKTIIHSDSTNRKVKELVNSKTIHQIEIPSTWSWVKVGEILFVTKLAGFEYTKYIKPTNSGEIPLLRAKNIKSVGLLEDDMKFIDRKTSLHLERSALTKRALLTNFVGSIGEVCLFNKSERWHLGPNVAKIEPYTGTEELINLDYLNLFFHSAVGQEELFKHMKATAQPSISMGTLRDVDLALPPLNEQRLIVEKVEALMSFCDALEEKLVVGL